MSLKSAIQSAIGTVRQVFDAGGLLTNVQRAPYTGVGTNGRDAFGPTQVMRVLYDDSDVVRRDYKGGEVTVSATITVLDGTVIHDKDRWITPDGKVRQPVRVDGGVIATGDRLVTVVWL